MNIATEAPSLGGRIRTIAATAVLAAAVLWWSGCRTTGGSDWDKRIGEATFADAVSELGQPERSVELSDGSLVAQWLHRKGEDRLAHKILYGGGPSDLKDEPRMSDKYLNMTFDQGRKLTAWRWSYK